MVVAALSKEAIKARVLQIAHIRADRAAAERAALEAELAIDDAFIDHELYVDELAHRDEYVLVDEEATLLARPMGAAERAALEVVIAEEVRERRPHSMLVVKYDAADRFGTCNHPLVVCRPCGAYFELQRAATPEEFGWVRGGCMLCPPEGRRRG
jgi:hypothetical protein